MKENSPTLMAQLSAADWEKTPESVKRLVKSWVERTLAIRAAVRRIKSRKPAAERAGETE